jgi:hypothetical protein
VQPPDSYAQETQPDPPLTSVNSVLDPLPSDAPRAPTDPKNLEGLWMYGHPFYGHIQRTTYGTPVPINDAGAKVLTERVGADNAGRPIANQTSGCRRRGRTTGIGSTFPLSSCKQGFRLSAERVTDCGSAHESAASQRTPTAAIPLVIGWRHLRSRPRSTPNRCGDMADLLSLMRDHLPAAPSTKVRRWKSSPFTIRRTTRRNGPLPITWSGGRTFLGNTTASFSKDGGEEAL